MSMHDAVRIIEQAHEARARAFTRIAHGQYQMCAYPRVLIQNLGPRHWSVYIDSREVDSATSLQDAIRIASEHVGHCVDCGRLKWLPYAQDSRCYSCSEEHGKFVHDYARGLEAVRVVEQAFDLANEIARCRDAESARRLAFRLCKVNVKP